jgi:DNA-binding MarR family transcriptional regulator
LLRRAWFSLNQAFRRRIAHLDLTPDQYTALRTVSEGGPTGLAQRALTGLMSSDPNTIAALLERMEAAGVVRRDPDPDDGRVKRVRLTPAGETQLLAARSIALALQEEVLGVLPPREREAFLARLERVADAAREAAEASPRPSSPPAAQPG